jgi:hypothetical protein
MPWLVRQLRFQNCTLSNRMVIGEAVAFETALVTSRHSALLPLHNSEEAMMSASDPDYRNP